MRLDPDGFSIKELIDRIDGGRIALPEFQRDFEWRPREVSELLLSVARKWPIGSFLLLEIDDPPPFAIRELAEAPKPSNPDRLILDGQQRSTAIYHAFGEHSKEVYYVELARVASDGELDDDDLKFEKETKFSKRFANLKAMADARVAKVSTLINPVEWQQWLNHLPEGERSDMVKLKESELPGFSSFDIPAHRLEKAAKDNLAAVAKIFETINRTGRRLATFDLMVARLYPDMYLKREWDKARDDFTIFPYFEFDEDDGIEVLKVIALREHLRQKKAGGKVAVKGVREGDVLELPRDLVIQEWPLAVRALVSALEWTRDTCGTIRRGLLPPPAMVLVLADVLHPESARRPEMEDDLQRWYWATMFRQDYAQGANTQAVADARELRAWQENPAQQPERLKTFRVDGEELLDGRRRNEQLLRGLMGLSVTRDARDWIQDKRFRDLSEPLEVHHVFPNDLLKDHYTGEKDPVANFTLLTKSTNAALRDKQPKDVLLDPAVKHAAITTHPGIDLAWMKEDPEVAGQPDKYTQRFLDKRAEALRKLMYEKVGIKMPALAEAAS
jgi:hypothetical protein